MWIVTTYGTNKSKKSKITLKKLIMKTMTVNKIDANANITPFCEFCNSETLAYNMITLCMQLHNCNNIWDTDLRDKFSKNLNFGNSGKTIFFELKNEIYITVRK